MNPQSALQEDDETILSDLTSAELGEEKFLMLQMYLCSLYIRLSEVVNWNSQPPIPPSPGECHKALLPFRPKATFKGPWVVSQPVISTG